MIQRAYARTVSWASDVAALLGRSVGHSYETYQGQGRSPPEMRSPLLAHRGPVRGRQQMLRVFVCARFYGLGVR